MKEQLLSQQITIRLTEEERNRINAIANQLGMTTGKFIREVLNEKPTTVVEKQCDIMKWVCNMYYLINSCSVQYTNNPSMEITFNSIKRELNELCLILN